MFMLMSISILTDSNMHSAKRKRTTKKFPHKKKKKNLSKVNNNKKSASLKCRKWKFIFTHQCSLAGDLNLGLLWVRKRWSFRILTLIWKCSLATVQHWMSKHLLCVKITETKSGVRIKALQCVCYFLQELLDSNHMQLSCHASLWYVNKSIMVLACLIDFFPFFLFLPLLECLFPLQLIDLDIHNTPFAEKYPPQHRGLPLWITQPKWDVVRLKWTT